MTDIEGRHTKATIAALLSIIAISGWMGLSGQARPSSGTSFTLGVLRRDGVVVPFASYDGNKWSNRWPAPGRRPDIPISTADSPRNWWLRDRPVGTWTGWPIRGDSRVIHVRNPVNLTVECQAHVGLQTDYASAEPPVPPKMQPYPKDGLATAGDVLIEPVEILDSQSADWAAVAEQVAGHVTEAETPLMAGSRFDRSFTQAQRASQAFTLEILFRSPGPRPGTTQLYFEGVKRYPRFNPRFPSDLLTYAVGYAILDPAAPPRVTASATLSDNTREGLVYTLVLGSFQIDTRRFWAVQRSAWGFERYDILELAEPDVRTVFSTWGGICQ